MHSWGPQVSCMRTLVFISITKNSAGPDSHPLAPGQGWWRRGSGVTAEEEQQAHQGQPSQSPPYTEITEWDKVLRGIEARREEPAKVEPCRRT